MATNVPHIRSRRVFRLVFLSSFSALRSDRLEKRSCQGRSLGAVFRELDNFFSSLHQDSIRAPSTSAICGLYLRALTHSQDPPRSESLLTSTTYPKSFQRAHPSQHPPRVPASTVRISDPVFPYSEPTRSSGVFRRLTIEACSLSYDYHLTYTHLYLGICLSNLRTTIHLSLTSSALDRHYGK